MKRILPAVIMFSASLCQALDPAALTNAAIFVKTTGLESEHSAYEVMACAAQSNGWTQQECADVLFLAYKMYSASTNAFDVGCSRHAVTLLGEFGETNSIPHLVEIMRTGEGVSKKLAGQGYLRIAVTTPFPGWEIPLKEEILRSPVHGGSFAWNIYNLAALDLEYAGLPPSHQRNLLRFLLDQTAIEQGERAMLDEILCREVPKWRASPQRLANAERMIREHSDDAGAASFFEGVRADALSAAATARERNPDGRSSGAPADFPQKGDDTKDAADPWADLLDDLPEKKPWVPPDGMVPAS